jgi:proteasome activator subunit 4
MVLMQTLLTMVPVLTSFLPPAHAHLYLPACFTVWKAFNSGSLDDRFMELCGELSEEHVSAPVASESEDGALVWKDVGIWSRAQWDIIVGKGLSSMGRSPVIFLLQIAHRYYPQVFRWPLYV